MFITSLRSGPRRSRRAPAIRFSSVQGGAGYGTRPSDQATGIFASSARSTRPRTPAVRRAGEPAPPRGRATRRRARSLGSLLGQPADEQLDRDVPRALARGEPRCRPDVLAGEAEVGELPVAETRQGAEGAALAALGLDVGYDAVQHDHGTDLQSGRRRRGQVPPEAGTLLPD